MQRPDGPGFVTLLAVAATGVYLLVILGATAALSEAAAACGSWPVCRGPLTVDRGVALGHRLAAALVGVVVGITALVGWRAASSRRVRITVLAAFLLYPAQVAVGAAVVVGGGTGPLSSLHLLLGVAIFASFVVALAWQLEAETAVDHRSTRGVTAGHPTPSPDPPEDTTTNTASGNRGWADVVLAYARLTKPRLMWLLCLVASAGMALAAGPNLSPWTVTATLGGGVLAIGASGTFNHVLERDVDRRMARTADRPLPADRVPVRNALVFGGVLTIAAVAVFLQVNLLAAALGLSAILFYSVIYTLVLKPNTVQNTVLGGAAGALPALIGWVAVTGRIGLPGLALAGVVFLWTPAHFYNLALAYREDYERGGFPMLPVARGEAVARKHVLLYLGATLVAAVVLAAVSTLGWLYATISVVVGAAFLWAVIRLHRERTDRAALRAFHASNAYLGLVLVAVVLDAIVA